MKVEDYVINKLIELSVKYNKLTYNESYFYWQLITGTHSLGIKLDGRYGNLTKDYLNYYESVNEKRFRNFIRKNNLLCILDSNSCNYVLSINDSLPIEFPSSDKYTDEEIRYWENDDYIRLSGDSNDYSIRVYHIYKESERIGHRISYIHGLYLWLLWYDVMFPNSINLLKVYERQERIFRRMMRMTYNNNGDLYPLDDHSLNILDKFSKCDCIYNDNKEMSGEPYLYNPHEIKFLYEEYGIKCSDNSRVTLINYFINNIVRICTNLKKRQIAF